MKRSLVTNEIIPPIEPGETGKHPALAYYRNLFWEIRALAPWGKLARPYRELRLACAQYNAVRDEVQSLTTFDALQTFMNEKPWALFLSPFNVLDDRRNAVLFERAKITSVIPNDDISNSFEHSEYGAEGYEGSGWTVDFMFKLKAGKFDLKSLRLGLAALGIYATQTDYTDDEDGDRAYQVTADMLVRDFKFTDDDDNRWRYKGSAFEEDFEDDELEEHLSDEEKRARWYEAGYGDEDIEGLFDGYR